MLIHRRRLACRLARRPPEKRVQVLSLLDDLKKKVLLDGEVEQKQYEKSATPGECGVRGVRATPQVGLVSLATLGSNQLVWLVNLARFG